MNAIRIHHRQRKMFIESVYFGGGGGEASAHEIGSVYRKSGVQGAPAEGILCKWWTWFMELREILPHGGEGRAFQSEGAEVSDQNLWSVRQLLQIKMQSTGLWPPDPVSALFSKDSTSLLV